MTYREASGSGSGSGLLDCWIDGLVARGSWRQAVGVPGGEDGGLRVEDGVPEDLEFIFSWENFSRSGGTKTVQLKKECFSRNWHWGGQERGSARADKAMKAGSPLSESAQATTAR